QALVRSRSKGADASSAPSANGAHVATEDPGWRALDITFCASGDTMLLGTPSMSAAWRLFLFGNGSPTHHLGLLTGYPTEVDVIGLHPIGASLDGAPEDISAIVTPRCRRQVWLRNSNGERLGYATSWLNEKDVGTVFKNQKIPIGKNIMQNRTELFRDMKSVYCGTSKELEAAFGHPGPFWGRSYLFWNGGRPVAFIYEVFSPALEKYMGKVLI
uniref:Chorismate lyase n=1 Tax=Globisporangium ultimum (strain ATCC 200006 / CBS 805.95 / DAOM BR144) TaxID=431595 RepID=K3WF82_GLOUD